MTILPFEAGASLGEAVSAGNGFSLWRDGGAKGRSCAGAAPGTSASPCETGCSLTPQSEEMSGWLRKGDWDASSPSLFTRWDLIYGWS